MSVKWNGEEVKLRMRRAVATGLTEVALEAEGIARNRMPPAAVKERTGGRGGTVYATPSSDPSGYPGYRTSSFVDSLTASPATESNLRAAFGVFGGSAGIAKLVTGRGAEGYPAYLERKPTSRGGRRWARRTIDENRKTLERVFLVAARKKWETA